MMNELLQELESIRKTTSSNVEGHSLSDLPSEFSAFREETVGLSVGSPGKTAALDLRFERHGDKTYLVDHYDKMPSKVLRAIYYDPELPGLPYVLLLNPSGGTLQGDRYSYMFQLGRRAHAFLADTEATKIYKMDRNYASRLSEVSLGKDAVLEYISREVIPYARSRWYQCATFRVSEGSRFFFSEIFCPGRIATNEFWDFDIFASKLIVESASDHKPMLYDSLLFRRDDRQLRNVLFGKWRFLLSTYWFSDNAKKEKETLRTMFGDSETLQAIFAGVTSVPYDGGLIVKALSSDLETLKNFQLSLWRHFRKTEFGTETPELRMY
jgi:urease accessory protein